MLSAYNARQFHHIYPKGYLNSQGISFHEANVVANICFLSASENNTISDKNPQEYFRNIPPNLANKIFDSALIPEQARKGDLDFESFISLRTNALMNAGMKLMADGVL